MTTYRLVAPPPPPPRRRLLVASLATCAVAVLAVFAIAASMMAAAPSRPSAAACDPALASATAGAGSIDGFGTDQVANARAIVEVGREMAVPERGLTVAIATALQESTLRNLDHGDRDSLGLFQQRPSMGWGSPAQVRDPAHAARRFFEGLMRVDGWERLPVTVAAQRVQRSAFPDAYAKWEGRAAALVTAVAGVTDVAGCATAPVTVDTVAARAIEWAHGQLGKPYLWGATGPGSFDCSGLMMRAFAAAGVTLPRTSRQQFTAGARIPRADARPGDLVFWAANPANPATIRHVAVYLGDDRILEAPRSGVPVRIRALGAAERGLLPVVVRPGAMA